ncbi:MAG: hypothetical protein JST26_06560 [Bacteroidetes bacterium]|nr:hypothetical protein [Bacteroidota bacterium]
MPSKLKIRLVFLILFGLFVFLSLNRHSHAKPFTYHAELWADKAGYNVYLPATFIYKLDASRFLAHADSLTGNGFYFDTTRQTIITKYPYGVALLQSPFWFTAHAFAADKTGYSEPYLRSVDIAGCFYLTLGMYFMFLFFSRRLSLSVSALLLAFMICCTGIFYYGIFEGGMSHIYSFCVLAAIIYQADTWLGTRHARHLFFMLLWAALYVIIRPIDAVFVLVFLPFSIFVLPKETQAAIRQWMKTRWFLMALISGVLIVLPQLLYYRYAFGNMFVQPYKNEGFTSFSGQHLLELLFSSNNGLFIYYPALLFILVLYAGQRHALRVPVFVGICVYILIYSSWWSTSLGCGFGHRAINDIVPLLFIPVCWFSRQKLKWSLVILALFSILNLKFIFSFDGCLYQNEPWNYSEYIGVLLNEIK